MVTLPYGRGIVTIGLIPVSARARNARRLGGFSAPITF
jgi:hypothetical protein